MALTGDFSGNESKYNTGSDCSLSEKTIGKQIYKRL